MEVIVTTDRSEIKLNELPVRLEYFQMYTLCFICEKCKTSIFINEPDYKMRTTKIIDMGPLTSKHCSNEFLAKMLLLFRNMKFNEVNSIRFLEFSFDNNQYLASYFTKICRVCDAKYLIIYDEKIGEDGGGKIPREAIRIIFNEIVLAPEW